jgi:hypothetical protein
MAFMLWAGRELECNLPFHRDPAQSSRIRADERGFCGSVCPKQRYPSLRNRKHCPWNFCATPSITRERMKSECQNSNPYDVDPRPFEHVVTYHLRFGSLLVCHLPRMHRHLSIRTSALPFGKRRGWLPVRCRQPVAHSATFPSLIQDSLTFANGDKALGVISTSGLTFNHSPTLNGLYHSCSSRQPSVVWFWHIFSSDGGGNNG